MNFPQAAVMTLQWPTRRHVQTTTRWDDALHWRLGVAAQAAAALGEDIPDAVAGMERRLVAAGHGRAAAGLTRRQRQASGPCAMIIPSYRLGSYVGAH